MHQPPVTLSGLTPSPASWFDFCEARGDDADCVPRATALLDGAVTPPRGWRDYCGRTDDIACARRGR